MPDETTEHAHLVLPDHTPLESLGRRARRARACARCVQPTLRPLYDTRGARRHAARRSAARSARAPRRSCPQGSFRCVVEAAWAGDATSAPRSSAAACFERDAVGAGVARRGRRLEVVAPKLERRGRATSLVAFPHGVPRPTAAARTCRGSRRSPTPSPRSPGRAGPRSARRRPTTLGVEDGDVLAIETSAGKVEVPALVARRHPRRRGRGADRPGPHGRPTAASTANDGRAGRRARRAACVDALPRERRRERRPRVAHREGEASRRPARTSGCRCSSAATTSASRQLGERDLARRARARASATARRPRRRAGARTASAGGARRGGRPRRRRRSSTAAAATRCAARTTRRRTRPPTRSTAGA